MNTKIFYQAVLTGVVSVLLGLVLSLVVFSSLKPELVKECEMWDKYYVFETTMFFTGILIRLLMELDAGKKYLLSQ
jgi:hypothetical protein